MAKRLEAHVSGLECSDTEKAEIAEEMLDHLMMLKEEFQKKGYSEHEAINQALLVFGEDKKISSAMQEAMFPYLKFVKWGGSLSCFLLAFLLLKEGFILLESMKNIDGAGIGVYFLLFEVNDHVLNKDILSYAIGFFVASGMISLSPFFLFQRRVIKYVHSVWQQ